MSSRRLHRVHEYYVGKTVTRGGFCSIRIGLQSNMDDPVAIKVISKTKAKKCRDWKQLFFNEMTLSRFLIHRNIVHVHDTVESANLIFIVMDLLSRNLREALETGSYNQAWKLRVADEVLAALEYLHLRDICHRDIKLENVMLDEDENVYLTDFGFVAFAHDKVSGAQGSIGYVAPEVTQSEPYDGKKADMWSFGCLLYHLFVGDLPFGETANSSGCSGDHIEYPGVPEAVAQIIKSLLNPEPELRPSATEIRALPVFDILKDRSDSSIHLDDDLSQEACCRVAEILHLEPYELTAIDSPSRERTMFILVCESMNGMDPSIGSKGCILPSSSYPPPRTSRLNMFVDGKHMLSVTKSTGVVSAELQKLLIKNNYCVSTSITGVKTAIINKPDDDIRVQLRIIDNHDGECVILAQGDESHVEAIFEEMRSA